MKLTPLDIKRHQFEKGFRGYDPDEVDGFLKQVADRFEALQEEIRLAQERTRETEAKLQHYERVELALQEALESAKATAKRAEEDADRRAAVVIEEAELRAQKITQEAERERFGMKQDLIKLSARQAEVAARLRGFLMSELEIVSDFQGDDRHGLLQLDDASELLLEAPDKASPAGPSISDEGTGTGADETPRPDELAAADEPAETAPDPSESQTSDEADGSQASPEDPPAASPPAAEADTLSSEAQGDEAFQPFVVESSVTPPEASEPEHVVLAPPPTSDTEPLGPDESGVVGASRPVEAARAATPMPADPWTIPTPSVVSSDDERERIRRILEDLD